MSLVDNLDAYNDGDLNGQGNWVGDILYDIAAAFALNGSVKGTRVIDPGVPNANINNAFAGDPTGNQVFYMKASQVNGSAHVIMSEGGAARIQMGFRNDGDIKYFDGAAYQIIPGGANYNADQEYKIEIEWRTVDNKARYRIDDGVWTAWDTTNAGWVTIDGLTLNCTAPGGHTFFYDEFSDPNAPAAVGRSFGSII